MTCKDCIHYNACMDCYAVIDGVTVQDFMDFVRANPNIEDTCKTFTYKFLFDEAQFENMRMALQIMAALMKKLEDAYEEGQRELSKLPNLFSF